MLQVSQCDAFCTGINISSANFNVCSILKRRSVNRSQRCEWKSKIHLIFSISCFFSSNFIFGFRRSVFLSCEYCRYDKSQRCEQKGKDLITKNCTQQKLYFLHLFKLYYLLACECGKYGWWLTVLSSSSFSYLQIVFLYFVKMHFSHVKQKSNGKAH